MAGNLVVLSVLLLASVAKALSEGADSLVQDEAALERAFASTDHAAVARWLVHNADYGVTSTHSTMRNGYPFGNVLSVSDGPRGSSTGRVLFFVATISQFVEDVQADARMSFTVTQEQAAPHRCFNMDPEWPLCARATLFGNASEVTGDAVAEVQELMFARHPSMRVWPHLAHKWAFYELQIDSAHVLDFFGGFHEVDRGAYFKAHPSRFGR